MRQYYDIVDEKTGETKSVTKLELVKSEMRSFMTGLAEKQSEGGRKGVNWQARVRSKLKSVLWNIEKPLANNTAINTLTADDFYIMYGEYGDLCLWIEDILDIYYTQGKPEFCMYCGITTVAFGEMMKNGETAVRETLDEIATQIGDSVLTSAENNVNKANASEFRLQAKGGLGHEVYTTKQAVQTGVPIAQVLFSTTSELAPPQIPQGYLENVSAPPEDTTKKGGRKKKS